MKKTYSRIKSLDSENKRGFIEKINKAEKTDFSFNEKSLKDSEFEKLRKGQVVEFEANITEKGNFANNIYSKFKIESSIKSLDFENKRGLIEKIEEISDQDFYFNEKNLKGVDFSKLEIGKVIKFEPNITEKGNYANKIEYIENPITSNLETSSSKKLVKSISEELKKKLLEILGTIKNSVEFEDFCFTILKLLGIETLYQYPAEAQAGRADGIFKLKGLEVIYDCTLREEFFDYKKDQIDNYINKIKQTQIKIGGITISLSSNIEKQVWIISKGETKKLLTQDDVKVIEVNIKDLINIFETKVSELEYTRLTSELLKLSEK